MNLRINHTRLSGGLLPLLLALLLLLSSATASASRNENALNCSRIPELSRTLLHKHISFHYVNDELRQRIVDTYVKRLDSSKSLYLSDEIDGLKNKLEQLQLALAEAEALSAKQAGDIQKLNQQNPE